MRRPRHGDGGGLKGGERGGGGATEWAAVLASELLWLVWAGSMGRSGLWVVWRGGLPSGAYGGGGGGGGEDEDNTGELALYLGWAGSLGGGGLWAARSEARWGRKGVTRGR